MKTLKCLFSVLFFLVSVINSFITLEFKLISKKSTDSIGISLETKFFRLAKPFDFGSQGRGTILSFKDVNPTETNVENTKNFTLKPNYILEIPSFRADQEKILYQYKGKSSEFPQRIISEISRYYSLHGKDSGEYKAEIDIRPKFLGGYDFTIVFLN